MHPPAGHTETSHDPKTPSTWGKSASIHFYQHQHFMTLSHHNPKSKVGISMHEQDQAMNIELENKAPAIFTFLLGTQSPSSHPM
jgi:hypothetical protein